MTTVRACACGCGQPVNKTWAWGHSQRAKDPLLRFWPKVKVQGGCALWTASRKNGYGSFRLRGRKVQAHRFAYEMFVGSVPDGLELDHLCRNRACVGVLPNGMVLGHLEPVTRLENVRRGITGMVNAARQRAKTHCKYGHPYNASNTYVDSHGWRYCRACDRETQRRRRQARKVA